MLVMNVCHTNLPTYHDYHRPKEKQDEPRTTAHFSSDHVFRNFFFLAGSMTKQSNLLTHSNHSKVTVTSSGISSGIKLIQVLSSDASSLPNSGQLPPCLHIRLHPSFPLIVYLPRLET